MRPVIGPPSMPGNAQRDAKGLTPPRQVVSYTVDAARASACLTKAPKRGYVATTPKTRESRKRLKPKPKTEGKSWQTRNAARKEKQEAYAAKLAENSESK